MNQNQRLTFTATMRKSAGNASPRTVCWPAAWLERGVRFIQLFHRGWDQHISIKNQLPKQCRDVDQASAALIKDLKRLRYAG